MSSGNRSSKDIAERAVEEGEVNDLVTLRSLTPRHRASPEYEGSNEYKAEETVDALIAEGQDVALVDDELDGLYEVDAVLGAQLGKFEEVSVACPTQLHALNYS